MSKADREEESSPDGEADGAGSDAFGEGQAKDSKAHAVDYILRERTWYHIVIGLRMTNICCEWTDGSAPITQYMCRIQVTLRAAAYSADVHVWEVSSGKLWEVG